MWKTFLADCIMMLSVSGIVLAHFGMATPFAGTMTDRRDADATLDLSFTHPVEMQGMPLARPKTVQVIANGETEGLKPSLKAKKIVNHGGWTAQYAIKRLGVYQFVMEPQPYWKPTGDCYIIRYARAYVVAFSEEEGWDEPAGPKTEIVPLTRPFDNYAGNVFQRQVLLNGKPVPDTDMEVELCNRDRRYKAPNKYIVTQVMEAGANGVLTYAVPFAGWWSFTALDTVDEKLDHDGTPKNAELGAMLWAEFVDPVKE